jgi:hypothetical protein
MSIECVVAKISLAAQKPPIYWSLRVIEYLRKWLVPVDEFGLFSPKTPRVVD